MKSTTLTCITTTILFAALAAPIQLAAANPVPLINQPLVPDAIAPGGAGFTLAVNGTGFVAGAVVNWNGSGRATTFVSGSELTATILATDIAAPHTASITVVNPTPGGGTSNVVFFDVIPPVAAIYLGTPTVFDTGANLASVATGDFNGDGKLDLAAANNGSNTVSVLLGNGDGTFQPRVDYPTGVNPGTIAVGDFNGDGKLDLAVSNWFDNTVSILLGNGDGTFQPHVDYGTGVGPAIVEAGDFNGDGHLDLALACYNGLAGDTVSVLLGNGDGTFQPHADYPTDTWPSGLAIGDFNGDGKLDMAAGNAHSNTVSILLGNGDGTFQPKVDYPTASNPRLVVTGDFNGDGKLDLAVATQFSNSVSILLGNGDGTFQPYVEYGTGADPVWVALGDLNGDGKLDLAVASYNDSTLNVLLGNGDGTFQPKTDYKPGLNPNAVAVGDFAGDGRPGLAVANTSDNTIAIFLQATSVSLSPAALQFGTQVVGTSSVAQTVTLTNQGGLTLNISGITVTGTDAADFSHTDTCGPGLAAGASCTISVIFTPTQAGPLTATLTVSDNGAGSPQSVALSGTGVSSGPNVTLSPTSLTFATQLVTTTSSAQTVTLSNYGSAALRIASINVTGADRNEFGDTSTCHRSLAAGASCTISVLFAPSQRGPRTADLSITDDAPGSPQKVSLTGTGTVVELNPSSLSFSVKCVFPRCYTQTKTTTLTNTGSKSLSIASITISGVYFSKTQNCPASLGAGRSCQVTVTFAPIHPGTFSGAVSITDNGGGSPQTVALKGSTY